MRISNRLEFGAVVCCVGLGLVALPHGSAFAQVQQPSATIPAKLQPQEPPRPPEPSTAFGYDIFRGDAGPIAEGPVDDQYILSTGDEVVISVWGELNLLYNLTVSEEGYIELPEEGGRIYTNGVTLKDLKTKVTQALSLIHESYIDAEHPSASKAFVDVKLGKIRKLLLYVVGEVRNPGAYTLSSGTATVVNLLHNAGGVKQSGSLREIRVRRADGRIDTLDLYDFLLRGTLDIRKSRLLSGDYVIVPLKQKAVTITGEIRRPLNYELIGNEGLKQLVGFAGGFTPDAYLMRSQLKRSVINRGEVFLDVNLDSLFADPTRNYPLVDHDELTILPNVQVRKSMVIVSGDGVTRPGTYEYTPGMTLKDLIEKAEGLREYAHLDRADLVRTQEDFSKKLTTFSLRDLYTQEKSGVFRFSGNTGKNFPLKEMDQVSIYSEFGMAGKDKSVTIEGHVKEPGQTLLAKNMSLFDLVFAKGGFQDPDFKNRTYLERAYIVRKVPGTIGQRLIPFNLGKVIDGDASASVPLEDEDVIRIFSNEQMTAKSQVSISGLVNKPGRFDLSENLTVEDLIVLAGGLRADAYKVEAVVVRAEGLGADADPALIEKSTARVPVEAGYALLPIEKRTPLKPFDRVTIRNLPGWEPLQTVTISGEVENAGDYSLVSRDERISNLIKRTGGFRKEAFPEGATLLRRRSVLSMTPGESPEVYGITLDLVEALENPGGEYDLILKDGDTIFIPSNPGTVEVRGAVRRPLILQHNASFKLQDYIDLSGGYLEGADKDNIAIFAANGAATKVKAGGWLFGRSSSSSVSPGSTIEVPFVGEATRLETVEVTGAVVKPALVQYIKGAKLGYYLNLCGGYAKNADIDKVVVHLLNGEILTKLNNAAFNPVVPAGSIIVVTAKSIGGSE